MTAPGATGAVKMPPATDRLALLCWPLALLLLVGFINAFPAWQALSQALGRQAAWLPFGLLVVVLLLLAGLAWRPGDNGRPWHWPAIAAGLALAGLGLLATDPAFPAKRIHVAEYAVLALVLRRALAPWLAGWGLTLAAALLGLLAGLHDEMVQGLLPSRSFGLRDIGVDGLGALAGALLGHGLRLAPGGAIAADLPWRALPWGWLGRCWLPLGLGVVLLAWPLEKLAGAPLPLWTIAPLLAGCANLLWQPPAVLPGLARLSLILLLFTAPLALYPLLSHVPPLVFR